MTSETVLQANEPRVLIAKSAIKVIEQEALLSADHETGGILLGRRLNEHEILVLVATKPGPEADHKVHTFAPDVHYANQQLGELRRQYPGTDFVGTWHKHPPTSDRPSSGDREQAQDILGDPDYAVDELVAPIVVVRGNAVTMKVYYVQRRETQQGDFAYIDHKEISNQEAEVLFRESGQDDVRRYEDRLGEELRLLSRYSVGNPTRLKDGSVVFTVQQGEGTIYLVCSALYPQVAPRVMVEQKDGRQREVASAVITNWTSARHLVEIADEVAAQLRQGSVSTSPADSEVLIPSRPASPEPPNSSRSIPPVVWGVVGTLALFSCVAAVLLARPVIFPAAEASPTIQTVAVSPETTPATASPTTGSAVAQATPSLPGHANLNVTPEWQFENGEGGGSCMLTFRINGGTPPYICTVGGQTVECDNYRILCTCGGENISVSYEVQSADRQRFVDDALFLMPACTPTPTPTPTSTPTPTLTPTALPEESVAPPRDTFKIPEPVRAYDADNVPMAQSITLGHTAICFTMRFAIQNMGERPVRVHQAGTAAYRDGQPLSDMFIGGNFELTDGLLQPGASVTIEVRGASSDGQGTICGFDLFEDGLKKDAVSSYNILTTDTLTFVPSIQVSWPDVDCNAAPECPWYPFTDSGSLTVRYRE